MKHLKRYNEALTSSDLESFDSEDISLALSEYWIPCDVALPKPNEVVIVYAPKAQMSTWAVCTFEKGISIEERGQMRGTERALTYTASDEHSNNRKPYSWKKMGPGTYFGQDVTHWLPLPKEPGTF